MPGRGRADKWSPSARVGHLVRGGQPDNGYRIEVDKRGPDEVRVEFEGQGDSDGRTEVRAECQGGVPVFDVEVD